jgi:hypothetical protein
MARWWRKGKRRKGKKSNQNCMWFVISLVFVKVTNSISAWETGKPKRKAEGKFAFDFIRPRFCVFGWKQILKLSSFSPPHSRLQKLLIYIEISLNWMLLA